MNTFRVIVGCEDCTGEDPYGCFDGGVEEVFIHKETGEHIFNDETGRRATSLEEAESLGWDTVMEVGPWYFSIDEYDEQDNLVQHYSH